jgi:amino acid transporter
MDPPLGFLLKLPPAMFVVPIVVKIVYLIGFILLICTCFTAGAGFWYNLNKDKPKSEDYVKKRDRYKIAAAVILIIITIVDFLFVSGLPPMWWPEGDEGNE